jgi:hypothetical protein
LSREEVDIVNVFEAVAERTSTADGVLVDAAEAKGFIRSRIFRGPPPGSSHVIPSHPRLARTSEVLFFRPSDFPYPGSPDFTTFCLRPIARPRPPLALLLKQELNLNSTRAVNRVVHGFFYLFQRSNLRNFSLFFPFLLFGRHRVASPSHCRSVFSLS